MKNLAEMKEKVLSEMHDDPFGCIDDMQCAKLVKSFFPDAYFVHAFIGTCIGGLEPERSYNISVIGKGYDYKGSGISFMEAVEDMFDSQDRMIKELEDKLQKLKGEAA